jgi:hypothetical protein
LTMWKCGSVEVWKCGNVEKKLEMDFTNTLPESNNIQNFLFLLYGF